MKDTASRLREIMNEKGIRQVDLYEMCQPICRRLGTRIGTNDINQYVTGKIKPGNKKLSVLGEALNVSEVWLMGIDVPRERTESEYQIISSSRKIPLLGTIACGTPILATENYDHMIDLPDSVNADFALTCHGDSMIDARIYSGDIVYIRQQPDVDDGQIAAVRIGDEATLKRVYHNADGTVTLVACNPRFAPVVIGKDGDNSEIVGLAVAFLGKIN